MEPSNWASEHSDALREQLALGKSYSEIARAINAKFKTDYSRSATIGRAKRLGLGGAPMPSLHAHPVPKLQQSTVPLPRDGLRVTSRWFVPVFESADLPKLRCVDIEPRHLSLLQLEAGDCRYPYGGDEDGEAITFCGHPKREGESYCQAHFHLTRGPGALPGRAVSKASLQIVEPA